MASASPSSRRRLLLLATVLAAAAGCEDPTTVEDVREPLTPPQVYSLYWDDMEECTQVEGRSMARVRWYVTDYFPGQPGILGQWNGRHEITLLRTARFDKGVVTHEMVHELLGGDGNHQDPAWETCQEFGLILGTDG